tara:strand:- start:3995 stop:4846 length:852 start_codon:yes stop_codon:yes gene_type:complete
MKVLTAVVNNPTFIEIQYHTLKKYMKSEYEFIVFNDAKNFSDFTNDGDITIKEQIEEVCKRLNIKCINIPNEQHKLNTCAARRCADSMNYMLQHKLNNPDKYLVIDSDMFLIDDFHISDYEDYQISGVLQKRLNGKVNYIWNGLYYFNIHKMNNKELLNWDTKPGCDVGGMMEEWLDKQTNKQYPDTDKIRWTDEKFHTDSIYYIKHLWSCSWDENEIPSNLIENKSLINFIQTDLRNQNGKYFCEIYDNKFLHYRAGGNWKGEGLQIHNHLSNMLKSILVEL